MSQSTCLTSTHQELGAKMVDFAGFLMPIHYGSQIEEHHAVRQSGGVFDVSHMLATEVTGEEASAFLQYVLANDVAKLVDGKALYSCMLNEQGGVIDDLLVYRLSPTQYRLVTNAGTRDKDISWLTEQAKAFKVTLTPRYDMAIIAIQGPKAIDLLAKVLPKALYQTVETLKPFHFVKDDGWFVARTGYTGEDGVEMMIPSDQAPAFWQTCLDAGIKPCGLGARDTLRLEAGFNLYGSDIDDNVTPLEAGLRWTVAMKDNRQFIGRTALEAQLEQGVARKLCGVVLEERGVLRAHYKVITDQGNGEMTSGTFSPTLSRAIGFALVPAKATTCAVEIRGKPVAAELCSLRFLHELA